MPDTDARLARLYDSLKAPAAGSRAPLEPYGFSGIAGSIWPYLTLSERLFISAPVGPSRRHTALCTASQSGDQLEFGGLFDPHVARLRGLRQSAGNARRQSRQGSVLSADAAIGFTPSAATGCRARAANGPPPHRRGA